MPLDPSKPLQQTKIPAGTVLFEAGADARMLCILHQGEVTATSRYGRKKLFSLGSNSTPGFSALLQQSNYSVTYETSKDSIISAFPARGDFSSLILGKLNVGMIAVRSLLQENIQTYSIIKKYSALLAMIQKVIDNLSIAYFKCSPNTFEAAPNMEAALDPVLPAAKITVSEFQAGGGEIPEPFTQEWLQSDQSSILKKNYEYESSFDMIEFNFLRRILNLPPNLQGSIFKTDINILQGLAIRLADSLSKNIQEIYNLQDSVDGAMEMIVSGEYCFAEKFFLLSDLQDSGFIAVPLPEFVTILKFVYTGPGQLLKHYQDLQGTPYPDVSPSLQKIQEFLKGGASRKADEEQEKAVQSTTAGIDIEAVRKELAGSPGQIMNFVGLPNDEAKQMLNHLQALRDQENPLDSGGEPRKLRRAVTKTYIKIFEQAFFKHKEANGRVPKNVQLMLDFGYFDDAFLGDEHIAALYEITDNTKNKSKYPIFRSSEWLTHIADKKEPCSIDEMGLSFFEKLKNDHKDKGWKRESDVTDEYDNFNARVKYESENFIENTVRLTSGSPATAFPILIKHQITQPLQKSFVTYEKLSETIEKVLEVDFSAFHREVLINDEEKGILKEFVQRQVIPNFILVPSIGTKVMMWQDLSGRSKSSLGRIAVPTFATADLYTLLLDAIGAFRWELTKSIMGPDWNNVSQSSITADYTDYVQFFKRNRDLSPEIREKLAAEFKRFRSDRDRYVNDYINWIKFESQGVLKLNKVARGIFYRHVPFGKPIRDNLSNQPAYADYQNRFKNIRTKKLRELEVRYRKYGELLPDVLQHNIDYYKV